MFYNFRIYLLKDTSNITKNKVYNLRYLDNIHHYILYNELMMYIYYN